MEKIRQTTVDKFNEVIFVSFFLKNFSDEIKKKHGKQFILWGIQYKYKLKFS